MKKYGILITVLVLTAALMCGCRRPVVEPTELPSTQGATLMPTTEPTTMPTTTPTTVVPTETSGDAAGNETGVAGTENGINSDTTDATSGVRSLMPGTR